MAGITTFLDESQMPNRSQEQKVFDNLVAYVFQNFPKWGREVNESLGAFNAALAGGAYALPYIFDTATTDSDPGAGKLRLSSTTQNTATVMRLDLTAGGQDYTTLIDTMDGSTSVIKGSIRLVKQADLSKWMTFDVTARAAPSGYRNLTVACTDSSSASPFAAGDALMLFFQRNGDKGETGTGAIALLASTTLSASVANIDFLNIFSSAYDRYTIEVQSIRSGSSGGGLSFRFAVAGVVVTSGYFNPSNNAGGGLGNGGSASISLGLISISAAQSNTLTMEVRNANRTTPKGLGFRGMTFDSSSGGMSAVSLESGYVGTSAISGFRIYAESGTIASGADIRIYGHRNN